MRFSLRELLVVLTVACLAAPTLIYANAILAGLTVVAMVAAVSFAVDVAGTWRGVGQAIALGFALPVIAYAILVAAAGDRELKFFRDRYWTTTIMETPHAFAVERFGSSTNGIAGAEVLGEADPGDAVAQADDTDPFADPRLSPFGDPALDPFGTVVCSLVIEQKPDTMQFMLIAHSLWALLFGYVGMKYAGWVYRRRQKRTAAIAEEAG